MNAHTSSWSISNAPAASMGTPVLRVVPASQSGFVVIDFISPNLSTVPG